MITLRTVENVGAKIYSSPHLEEIVSRISFQAPFPQKPAVPAELENLAELLKKYPDSWNPNNGFFRFDVVDIKSGSPEQRKFFMNGWPVDATPENDRYFNAVSNTLKEISDEKSVWRTAEDFLSDDDSINNLTQNLPYETFIKWVKHNLNPDQFLKYHLDQYYKTQQLKRLINIQEAYKPENVKAKASEILNKIFETLFGLD